MRLFLLFIAMLVLIALWLLSIADAGSVDLYWFSSFQDSIASYGYDKCKENIKDDWKYSCKNFILTLNSENGGWNANKASPKNKNGTRDHWLCQLNSAYYHKFINSEDFKDPYKQIDYCLWIWIDSKNENKMPWYWYAMRYKRDKWIIFNWLSEDNNNKPLIAKHDDSKPIVKPTIKPKKEKQYVLVKKTIYLVKSTKKTLLSFNK